MKRNEEFRRGCEWTLFSYFGKLLKTWQVTLNMQISNLGWSPSGPISRKRLCLVVKCRRSFSNVLWWNVAPFKLKFDIRSQYWFFCLDVYVFIEIKFYVSKYHCFRHNHYVNQFSNQRTNIKSPKEPKTHSLFVHNAISVFLWGFFSFFLYVFYLCVCVCVCLCVSVCVCVCLFPHFLINDEAFLNHHSTRNAKWIHQLKRC